MSFEKFTKLPVEINTLPKVSHYTIYSYNVISDLHLYYGAYSDKDDIVDMHVHCMYYTTMN